MGKRSKKDTYILPRVELEFIARRLEANSYIVNSDVIRTGMYALQDGEVFTVITGSKGIIEFELDDIPKIVEEMAGIYEDMIDRKRMGIVNA